MRCGSSHTSYALPEQLHATASVASASIATAHKPAVGLGLRGVRVNSKRRPVRRTEAPPSVQKPSQFSLFRAHFSKKMLPSIAMAAADCCAGDKDRATRCRPPARAGVQACRGAPASSRKIPVVEGCAWRPVHKRKAEDAWSCARRRRRRSCSSRWAIRRPDAGSCH